MTSLEIVNSAFEALFFGSGSWLGLLLLLSIMIGLLLKWEYTGAILLPISIFLGIEYLGKDMGWHCIIMFITSTFMLIYMMKKIKR